LRARAAHRRIQARLDDGTATHFHTLFEEAAPWSSWLGVRTLKNPLDLWVYQEILVETKPEPSAQPPATAAVTPVSAKAA
jgi:cephalosporin hydroxylase